MDIQTRKIKLIEKFLKIQSEEVISQLERIVGKEIKSSDNDDLKPMTTDEFNVRVDKSIDDSRNGRLIEASDLKAKIDKWRWKSIGRSFQKQNFRRFLNII